MCLAIPMRLKVKNGDHGEVEAGGLTYEVNLSLVPDANINDYVIIHAGFAIQRLDTEDAEETLKLFEEIGNMNDKIH